MQRQTILALMLVMSFATACGRNGSIAPPIPMPDTQRNTGPSYYDGAQVTLPEDQTPKKLAISPATIELPIGSTVQLTGTVQLDNGETVSGFTGVTFTLPGNNDQGPVIQKRDSGSGGVFVGQREGTVTVMGTLGDLKATATITVVKGNDIWQQVKGPTQNDLRAVKMINDHEAWAVGMGGTMLHYLNGNWRMVPTRSSNPNLTGIDFGDINEGWAVGDSAILRFANGQWHETGSPVAGHLKAVDMINRHDGWIVGESNGKGVVLRYQGGMWTDAGAGIKDPLNAVCAVAPNDVWAVGDSSFGKAPAIYHYDGTSWQKAKFGGAWPNINVWTGSFSLKGIKMLNGNQGWAVGSYSPIGSSVRGEQGVMFRYDQNLGTWRKAGLEADDSRAKNVTYNAVGMITGSQGWALGNVTKKPLDFSAVAEYHGHLFDVKGDSLSPSSHYQANGVGSGFYGIDVMYNGNGVIVGDKGLILQRLYDVNRPMQSPNTGGYQGSYNSNYNNMGGGYYGSVGGSYDAYGSQSGYTGGYGQGY